MELFYGVKPVIIVFSSNSDQLGIFNKPVSLLEKTSQSSPASLTLGLLLVGVIMPTG
jgi:hypothetical protein